MNCVRLDIRSIVVEANDKTLLDDISFQVQKGRICALIGHNGAGKSTTLKTIMGLVKKKQGHISINGYTMDNNLPYKRQYTYIPEEPILLEEFTVFQYLQFYSSLYNITERNFHAKLEYYASLFALKEKLHEYPENLSKGMRQKVMIIGSLMVEAPFMIIDEPFIGLDIKAANVLEQELKKRANQGVAILLTSHVVERIKSLCDQYIVLHNGKITEQGSINQLTSYMREEYDGVT